MERMTKKTPSPDANEMLYGDSGPQRPPREGHRADADAYPDKRRDDE